MDALHTAFSWKIDALPQGGVNIVISERLRIEPELKVPNKPFNPFGFTITDEVLAEPKTVALFMASPGFDLPGHMNSLTDDLIYNQWFRVKIHKPKKAKA